MQYTLNTLNTLNELNTFTLNNVQYIQYIQYIRMNVDIYTCMLYFYMSLFSFMFL